MKPNKWKSHSNIYWPDAHTSWKFIKPKLLEIDDFEVLVSCGSSHFSYNISTSINDCAKWNKSNTNCLLSIKISEFQSHELLEMMRTPEDFGTIKQEDTCVKNPSAIHLYLEAALKNIDLPYENLAEAYIKSRIMKWPKSSVEQKYKVPAPWWVIKLIEFWEKRWTWTGELMKIISTAKRSILRERFKRQWFYSWAKE